MTNDLDNITDPEERLAWLRDRGRKDAQAVIERGVAGTRETYKEDRKLPWGERSAYLAAYRDRMHERTLERRVAGIEVVSPDYRGPLTEKDWWRGVHVIPPPDRPVRPERPERP